MNKETLFNVSSKKETKDINKFIVYTIRAKNEDSIKFEYLRLYLGILGIKGENKIKLVSYLISITRNEDCGISGNYKYFSEHSQISLPTVTAIIKELIKKGILFKIFEGNYKFDLSFLDIVKNPLPILYNIELQEQTLQQSDPKTEIKTDDQTPAETNI